MVPTTQLRLDEAQAWCAENESGSGKVEHMAGLLDTRGGTTGEQQLLHASSTGRPTAKRKRDEAHQEHGAPEHLQEGGGEEVAEGDEHARADGFEALVLDEDLYRERRHAPLPEEVQRVMDWSHNRGGGTGANVQRFGEEIVRRKQAQLDRTNSVYKALARKSFQVSVTLLLPQAAGDSSEPAATTDIYRTIVLPAGTQHYVLTTHLHLLLLCTGRAFMRLTITEDWQ